MTESPPPFTDEDARTLYEATRYRFEWQERYEQRFAARVRQMLAVLTGLGAAAFFFAERLLGLEASACSMDALWNVTVAWHGLRYLVCFLAATSVLATASVVRVFWSARYSALPRKSEYDNIWAKADEFHKKNSEREIELSRSALMMKRMSEALLEIVDKNARIDKKRQDWLDLSKNITVVAAGCLLATAIIYLYLLASLA